MMWGILEKEQPSASDTADRIIYLGEAQDAYPRLLVLDKDLSAAEKILWMYLRLFVDLDHKSKPCPTYDDMMVDLNIGSRETISNALLVLRGTRWISLIGPRRDFKNRITRNLYALHSEPMTPSDVLELDDSYLQVLDKMQAHRSSKIRGLGTRLDEGVQHYLIHQSDPYSPLEQLNTRLDAQNAATDSISKPTAVFFNRLFNHNNPVQIVMTNEPDQHKSDPSTKIELGPDSLVRKSNFDSKSYKNSRKTPSKYENRTTISSSSGNYINTTTTKSSTTLSDFADKGDDPLGGTPPTQTEGATLGGTPPTQELYLHDVDIHLTPNEKKLLTKMLMKINTNDRQRMIDELAGQVVEKRDTPYQIRNTIAFAGTLIKLYLKGTPSWSSSSEVMAQKRLVDKTSMSVDEIKAREHEAKLAKQAAHKAHLEKLKKWEAELKAEKQQGDKLVLKTRRPRQEPKKDNHE